MTAIEAIEHPTGAGEDQLRPIRVLRVGNSQDTFGEIDERFRCYRVAGQMLEEATGRPVEHILHWAWPTPALPSLVDRWIERYQPDMLYLKVIDYWFAFESVPVRLERLFGRLGVPLARAGKKAASTQWLSFNPFFRTFRLIAQSTIGGEPMFEPEQVVEQTTAAVRRALQHEELVVVIDGPLGLFPMSPRKKKRRWAEERRQRVHAEIEELCRQHHIVHRGRAEPRYLEIEDPVLGDKLHYGPEGQVRLGQEEGAAMVEAWLRAHPAGPARPVQPAGRRQG